MRRPRRAAQVYRRHRQRARIAAERWVDENAADVVLFEQGLHHTRRDGAILAGQVDEIGAAIGSDHHVGPWRPPAPHPPPPRAGGAASGGGRRRTAAPPWAPNPTRGLAPPRPPPAVAGLGGRPGPTW